MSFSEGSVGQQLRANQLLLRAIADQKLKIVDADGRLTERLDVMIGPFQGEALGHLFDLLDKWMQAEKDMLRQLIKDQIGV